MTRPSRDNHLDDGDGYRSIEHRASSIKHRASSIKHRASSIEHQASSIEAIVMMTPEGNASRMQEKGSTFSPDG
jgi:hypothetical protein